MKIAIISDIHANLHALEAVIADATRRGASQFLCLGDVVGYGPLPDACVEKLRDLKIPTVLGNHDKWTTRNVDLNRYTNVPTAISGIYLAREQLTTTNLNWLRKRPLLLERGTYAITHGSFHALDAWDYICDSRSAMLSFARLSESIGFFGHTHEAGIWRSTDFDWIEPKLGRTYKLKRDERYLINPGSVGNPRTPSHKPDNRAQYLLFDALAIHVTFYRIKYNIKACTAAMRKVNLPEEMISRIELGY